MRPNGFLSTQIATIAMNNSRTHDIKILEALSKDLEMKPVNTYCRSRHGRQYRHRIRVLLFRKVIYMEHLVRLYLCKTLFILGRSSRGEEEGQPGTRIVII